MRQCGVPEPVDEEAEATLQADLRQDDRHGLLQRSQRLRGDDGAPGAATDGGIGRSAAIWRLVAARAALPPGWRVTYAPVVVDIQRSYTAYILTGVAVVLLIVGFLVGWMLKGSRGPPTAPEAMHSAPPMEEHRAPEPEEMPAEEEMTTEEEEL